MVGPVEVIELINLMMPGNTPGLVYTSIHIVYDQVAHIYTKRKDKERYQLVYRKVGFPHSTFQYFSLPLSHGW